MTIPTITVAVPAYNRADELQELLQSFLEAGAMPEELLIVEDCSAQRARIRALVEAHTDAFAARRCVLRLIENERNLGYDGNVRAAIDAARSEWVMLLGNDDVIAADGIEFARAFLSAHPEVPMVSRAFYRFTDDWRTPIGLSTVQPQDGVFSHRNSAPAMAFRLCGFVGGLIVKRDWAVALATPAYDGTLYYQMYLAFNAYCEAGIGYIGRTLVGGRAGNAPLFGSAASEKSVHLPGSYRPAARAHMWSSVLRIAAEVGNSRQRPLVDSVRDELDKRQSFHVFEMMASSPRSVLLELRSELSKIGLHRSVQSKALFWTNFLLGRSSRHVYRWARRVLQ